MQDTGKAPVESSYPGKLFVCTLAASLRLMMLNRAHANAEKLQIMVPNNSIDVIIAHLCNIRAHRREAANAWFLKPIAKKQRDMLSLLGLPLPPKTLG